MVSTLLIMNASWFALVTLGLPDLGRSLRSSPAKCLVFHLCTVLLCTWSSSATSLTPIPASSIPIKRHRIFSDSFPIYCFVQPKIYSSTESYWILVSCKFTAAKITLSHFLRLECVNELEQLDNTNICSSW